MSRNVLIKGINGLEIQFDQAQFLTGDEAIRAAVDDGVIQEDDSTPNDYYIENDDKTAGRVAVKMDPVVNMIALGRQTPSPADVEYLVCVFSTNVPVEGSRRTLPWQITVENGRVVRLEQQYLH